MFGGLSRSGRVPSQQCDLLGGEPLACHLVVQAVCCRLLVLFQVDMLEKPPSVSKLSKQQGQ